MKRTLHAVEVGTPEEAALPEEVQLSLAEIAGQAKEGLLALAAGTGLAVLHEAMGARGRAGRGPSRAPPRRARGLPPRAHRR